MIKPHVTHRFQDSPWYVLFNFHLIQIGTTFKIPLTMATTGSLYGVVEFSDRHRPWRYLALWLHWVLFLGLVYIRPFVIPGVSWPQGLLNLTAFIVPLGAVFGIFSQVNHLTEESMEQARVQRRQADTSEHATMLLQSWAVKQVETSNNFSHESPICTWFSTKLNYQIEHHLFPSINHYHLPMIAPVVQETCLEYGVNYKCYTSYAEVLGKMLEWMAQCKRDDAAVAGKAQ